MHETLPLCVLMPSPAGEEPGLARLWPPGARLEVRFLDGAPRLQALVTDIAPTWCRYANIDFVFGDAPDAPIRVTFAGAGLWAYAGTDALLVPPDQPTLGLGALKPDMSHGMLQGVILHMFGHVLGFRHTLPDAGGTVWDEDRLYAHLARLYAWSKEQVMTNVLRAYKAPAANYTAVDAHSIMTLSVPRELTVDGSHVDWRRELSDEDNACVMSCYPPLMAAMAAADSEPPGAVSLENFPAEPVPILTEPTAVSAVDSPVVSATTLREERIRLDVATPGQIVRDEAFALAVAVLQPDAPPLAIEDLPDVQSEEGSIFRSGAQELINYRIEIRGADCEVWPEHVKIPLQPGRNSRPFYFQVTAHKAGTCTLFVNAYQEDDALAAQTRLRIRVDLPVDEPSGPPSTRTEMTDLEVTDTMDIVLSPDEVEQFKEALKSAFQRGDLEQVVYFGLGVRMADIVERSNFNNEVNALIMWVNDNNRVADLLNEAREKNTGNVKLRDFAIYVQVKWGSGSSPAAQPDSLQLIVQQVRGQLVDELARLPVTANDLGRTTLLFGIPGADGLNRQPGNQRGDLDGIVIQLAQRGRLADGRPPLVILIDNALPSAAGYTGESTLRAIRERLMQAQG